jgi:probable F420-dependent oxidoreductase
MKYGICMFPTHYAIRPDELAAAAEQRGFESVFFPEHTHIPASRRTPFPGGSELPRQYIHTYDPFVALGLAAAATRRIRLATGICLVIQRDPIVLAKEVASLDHLSGGRFIFGIGGGWNVEEMENHGTAFKRRWQVLRERIEAMTAIWTGEEASYQGAFVKFDRIWSYPKPLQKPRPPVLLGSNQPAAFRRVVRYCDGWLPNAYRYRDIAAGIRELHRTAEQMGREPASVRVSVFSAPPDKAVIEGYEAVGVERAIFAIAAEERDKVLAALDRLAALI